MSAEPIADGPSARRPGLSLVAAPTATVSTLGFVGIILLLIALGLAGVMIVTTSVGAQSRELAGLRREATQLGYQRAALESELQRVSSANALALRATELGMVPNPYPAFINLADGSISGEPTPVRGDELPFLSGVKADPEPSQEPDLVLPADESTGAEQAPVAEEDLVTEDVPAAEDVPADLIASGATGEQQ